MRLHIGEIPDSPDFVPDDSWTCMPEPRPWVMQALALPVGLALTLALAVLWFTLTPLGHAPAPSVGECFGALLAVVPVHESLHLVMHPRTGDSIIGFWPSRLLFYTHYHSQLPCRRYLAVLIAPVVVISLVPLAVCALTATASAFLAIGSAINVWFASGDLFAVGLLLAQVPTNAKLRNKGWRLYWKA
jgi:putative zincin peptidase